RYQGTARGVRLICAGVSRKSKRLNPRRGGGTLASGVGSALFTELHQELPGDFIGRYRNKTRSQDGRGDTGARGSAPAPCGVGRSARAGRIGLAALEGAPRARIG